MGEPTKVAFEQEYSDGSGIEFGVYYDRLSTFRPISIKAVHEVDFPVDQLDWLIDALTAIRATVNREATP